MIKLEKQDKKPILEIKGLRNYYYTANKIVPAVDGVDLTVYPGEIIGIVGESGCGKSTVVRSLMGLLDPNLSKRVAGTAFLQGMDLFALSKKELCRIRGKEIAMIFQNPLSALDPVYTLIPYCIYNRGSGYGNTPFA